MKLSVITVCYNEKNIERTCQSIITQTTKDFEWVVIDGGSNAQTISILNKYKDRMSIFISEPDKGIFDAMNKGIKLSHGEYLNFMNGGDEFAQNDVIEKFIEKDFYGDIIYANSKVVEKDNRIRDVEYPNKVDKIYFVNRCINHQASFIKRNLFAQYGLYNDQLKIASDWEKWIVFAENNCTFEHWNETVAYFYHDGISSQMTKEHAQERSEILKKYFTATELKEAKQDHRIYNITQIKLFNLLPILKIKTKKDGHQQKINLFEFIPIYRITNKNHQKTHYLCSFIPLLRIKEG